MNGRLNQESRQGAYDARVNQLVSEGVCTPTEARRKLAGKYGADVGPSGSSVSAAAMRAALPGAKAEDIVAYCEEGLPIEEARFADAVKAEERKGASKTMAVSVVIATYPEIHSAYLKSYTARHGGEAAAWSKSK